MRMWLRLVHINFPIAGNFTARGGYSKFFTIVLCVRCAKKFRFQWNGVHILHKLMRFFLIQKIIIFISVAAGEHLLFM